MPPRRPEPQPRPRPQPFPALIVFDLDGTLIDSSEAIIDAVLAQAEADRLPVPDRVWAAGRIGAPPEETWVLLGAPDPVATMARFRERIMPTLAAGTRVLAGAREAVAALTEARVPQAVATSRTTEGALASLHAVDLVTPFGLVAGRDAVARPKPAPDLLLHVAAHFGCDPGQALMVGDTTADVLAARDAGMPCWAVLGGHADEPTLRQAGATRILGGVGELFAALHATTGA